MTQYLIQMSGVPGSGKSTVARGIAKDLDAIVIDHDDTKSAILSRGLENDLAGQASYEVIKVLAEQFIAQGFTVIIDSPCLYTELLNFGQGAANKYGAIYRYIECRMDNLEVLNHRINNRDSKPSQTQYGPLDGIPNSHQGKTPREGKELFRQWAINMKRPDADYLVIDTSERPVICIDKALIYVQSGTVIGEH